MSGMHFKRYIFAVLMRWCFFLKEILISDAGAVQVTTDI